MNKEISKTLLLRDALKEVLEAAGVNAYPDEAPQNAKYPYVVFTNKVITNETPAACSLEVNVWDEYHTFSRVNDVMDKIEAEVSEMEFLTDQWILWIYKGQRDNPADENKKIKRCREQFVLKTAERNRK